MPQTRREKAAEKAFIAASIPVAYPQSTNSYANQGHSSATEAINVASTNETDNASNVTEIVDVTRDRSSEEVSSVAETESLGHLNDDNDKAVQCLLVTLRLQHLLFSLRPKQSLTAILRVSGAPPQPTTTANKQPKATSRANPKAGQKQSKTSKKAKAAPPKQKQSKASPKANANTKKTQPKPSSKAKAPPKQKRARPSRKATQKQAKPKSSSKARQPPRSPTPIAYKSTEIDMNWSGALDAPADAFIPSPRPYSLSPSVCMFGDGLGVNMDGAEGDRFATMPPASPKKRRRAEDEDEDVADKQELDDWNANWIAHFDSFFNKRRRFTRKIEPLEDAEGGRGKGEGEGKEQE